jgi:hypothetical protein
MKLPVFLVAGLLVGGGLRLVWPRSDPANSPEISRANVRANEEPQASDRSEPMARPPQPTEKSSLVRSILQSVGLVPPAGPPKDQPSWLLVPPAEAALLRNTEYVEASIVATEFQVDEQCAPLFVQLGLSPEQEDSFRHLLAEMVYARHEITALSKIERREKPAAVKEMLADSDEAYRERIKRFLGPDRFAQFETYFDSHAERAELKKAFARVSALSEPLTPSQRDALVLERYRRKHGLEPSPSRVPLSPAQQAVFDEWRADETAQAKVRELLGGQTPRTSRALYSRATEGNP